MRILTLLLILFQLPQAPVSRPELPASMDGVVVDSVTKQPIGGAEIVVQSLSGHGSAVIVVTGNDGRFAFRNIPPGAYSIEARRSGYIPEVAGTPFAGGNGPLNSLVPNNAPVIQQLAPGQALSEMRFALTPGGVITGRLRDDYGDAVVGAIVQALRTTYRNGTKERTLTQSVISNDLGEYRFFMLKPGQYSIAVAPPTVYVPSVSPQTFSTPLFHPGTVDTKAATEFSLRIGETLEGVDFLSVPTRKRRIAGTVQGNGTEGVTIVLSPVNGTARKTVAITSDNPNPNFQFLDILPGTYELAASNVYGRAVVPVDVVNGDLIGARIYLGEGFRIPMRARVEGRPPGTDPQVEKLYFNVRPDVPVMGLEPQLYSPFADGRFIPEVLRRDYWIELDTARSPDFYVKSITLDGADILNQGLRVTSSVEGPVEIVVDTHFGEVQGAAAVPNVTIVLVPDAGRRNQRALYRSVKSGNGVFRFEKVPPGEYKLFAWSEDTIENGGPWLDPEYLKTYEDRATPVRIQAETKTVLDRPVPAF